MGVKLWAMALVALFALGGCGSFGLTVEERAKIIEQGVKLAGDEAFRAAYDKAIKEGLTDNDAKSAGNVARLSAELAAKVALEKATPPPAEPGTSKFGGAIAALLLAIVQAFAGRSRREEVI